MSPAPAPNLGRTSTCFRNHRTVFEYVRVILEIILLAIPDRLGLHARLLDDLAIPCCTEVRNTCTRHFVLPTAGPTVELLVHVHASRRPSERWLIFVDLIFEHVNVIHD